MADEVKTRDRDRPAPQNRPRGNTPLEQVASLQKAVNASQRRVIATSKRLNTVGDDPIREVSSLSNTVNLGPDGRGLDVALVDLQQKFNVLAEAERHNNEALAQLKDTHLGQPAENDGGDEAPALATIYNRMPGVGRDDADNGYTERGLMQARLKERAALDEMIYNDLLKDLASQKRDGPPRDPPRAPRAPLSRALWDTMTETERHKVARFEHNVYWPHMKGRSPTHNLLGFGLMAVRASGSQWNSHDAIRVLCLKLLGLRDRMSRLLATVSDEFTADVRLFMTPAATWDEWINLCDTSPLPGPNADILLHVTQPWFREAGWAIINGLMLMVRHEDNPPAVRRLTVNEVLTKPEFEEKAREYARISHTQRRNDSGVQYQPTLTQRQHIRSLNAIRVFFMTYGQQRSGPADLKRRRVAQHEAIRFYG